MTILTDIIWAETAWYSLKVMGSLSSPHEETLSPDISRQVDDMKKKFVVLPFPVDIIYVAYKLTKMYHQREIIS